MSRIIPELPVELPRRGNALTSALGRAVLGAGRWRVEGRPPSTSKMVVILGPHTSAWDLILALATRLALRLDASFLAKHTIFFWPLGPVLRYLGGIPVDRTASHSLVEQMGQRFDQSESLILALSPEGTRHHVDDWKTGFYYIAQRAGVPIVPVTLDFVERRVRFAPAMIPGGDMESEVRALKEVFARARGRHPDLA